MMRLLQKISTAMRGSAREGLEVVVDANAFRIFEQEIYEADRMDAMQHIDEQLLGTPDATDNSTRTAAILNRLKTRTA